MIVYRIEREKYLATTLHGIAASRSFDFRWNGFNTYMVYTAATRALAMLEVSVHLDLSEDLPNDRHFVEIFVPDDILVMELDKAGLPDGWNAKPPLAMTQHIGDEFVTSRAGAILKVPSAIIPQEYNYLINPVHPDAQRISVLGTEHFEFDQRWSM